MPGFTSAQTSNESMQDSNSYGKVKQDGKQRIFRLNNAHNYHITHRWKPTSEGGGFSTHHSQIVISKRLTENNPVGRPWFIMQLFDQSIKGKKTGDAYIMIGLTGRAGKGYTLSTSYAPNPHVVSGAKIKKAYVTAELKCAGKYHLLFNNCQKFARIFMTELGIKHKRKFFHA